MGLCVRLTVLLPPLLSGGQRMHGHLRGTMLRALQNPRPPAPSFAELVEVSPERVDSTHVLVAPSRDLRTDEALTLSTERLLGAVIFMLDLRLRGRIGL